MSRGQIIALLLLTTPASAADNGAVVITPGMAAGQALSIEVQNLTKLPVRVSGGSLAFAGAGSCTVALGADLAVPPAAIATATVADGAELLDCLQRQRQGRPTRLVAPFVLSERQLRTMAATDALAGLELQPAEASFAIAIGPRPPVPTTMSWSLPVR